MTMEPPSKIRRVAGRTKSIKKEDVPEKKETPEKKSPARKTRLKATQKLLMDGNSQLCAALKKNDAALISVAQAMLSTATAKMSECQAEVFAVMKDLHKLQRCESVRDTPEPDAKRKNLMSLCPEIKNTRFEPAVIEGRGVVYIQHVPHGFYEEQMREYFKQFGNVTRLRLSRSKKTGGSKGYAFVEFESEEVAKVVADSMKDYLMFRQRLMCKLMDPATIHPDTFKGCNRKFTKPKAAEIATKRHNQPKDPKKLTQKLTKKNRKQLGALKELGIKYEMEIANEKPIVDDLKVEEKLTKDWEKPATKSRKKNLDQVTAVKKLEEMKIEDVKLILDDVNSEVKDQDKSKKAGKRQKVAGKSELGANKRQKLSDGGQKMTGKLQSLSDKSKKVSENSQTVNKAVSKVAVKVEKLAKEDKALASKAESDRKSSDKSKQTIKTDAAPVRKSLKRKLDGKKK